ncbi:STM4015 family protein [Actinomadura sp. NPDC047616]|uniref:STM4015 family protein n=1 Tax=Actinomadura sp. NPDC047616 TaxID=3155914 RepID=UPI0033F5EE32
MVMTGHFEEFAGLPLIDFTDPDQPWPTDVGAAAWWFPSDVPYDLYDDGEAEFPGIFERFLDTVDTAQVTSLAVGFWEPTSPVDELPAPIQVLTGAADRLPALRNLSLNASSDRALWELYCQDITPLFVSFPGLTCLEVRGHVVEPRPVSSTALRRLRFESGGLPAEQVRMVGASDLPGLEHLDLWLGVADYGGDATVADLAPILSGERFPALRHLGLENSETADETAAAVAGAPVVARLESLSLALGTLTDRGAEALLSGQPLTHLRRLDLHHHFLSDGMMERVRGALPGVEVNLDARQQGRDRLFVAVSE